MIGGAQRHLRDWADVLKGQLRLGYAMNRLGLGACIPVLFRDGWGEWEVGTGQVRAGGRAGRRSGGYGALRWPAPGFRSFRICVGGGIVLLCMGIGV